MYRKSKKAECIRENAEDSIGSVKNQKYNKKKSRNRKTGGKEVQMKDE